MSEHNHKFRFHRTQVLKDGEVIAECPNPEAAWDWLHELSDMSIDWLQKHEGYAFYQPVICPLHEEIERLSVLEDKEKEIAALEAQIDELEAAYEAEQFEKNTALAKQWKIGGLCWCGARGPAEIRKLNATARGVAVKVKFADGTFYETDLERDIQKATVEGIEGILEYRREQAIKPWATRWDKSRDVTAKLNEWQRILREQAKANV